MRLIDLLIRLESPRAVTAVNKKRTHPVYGLALVSGLPGSLSRASARSLSHGTETRNCTFVISRAVKSHCARPLAIDNAETVMRMILTTNNATIHALVLQLYCPSIVW